MVKQTSDSDCNYKFNSVDKLNSVDRLNNTYRPNAEANQDHLRINVQSYDITHSIYVYIFYNRFNDLLIVICLDNMCKSYRLSIINFYLYN
jgi:hypothetical protein